MDRIIIGDSILTDLAYRIYVQRGGPTFAVFQARVRLPCPCINISLLVAVVSPTAQESKPKPRRLVRGSCTMALPVPWCLSRRRNELSSPEGGKATRTHKGRAGRRGPSAAPRQQEQFHFTYCTALVPRSAVGALRGIRRLRVPPRSRGPACPGSFR